MLHIAGYRGLRTGVPYTPKMEAGILTLASPILVSKEQEKRVLTAAGAGGKRRRPGGGGTSQQTNSLDGRKRKGTQLLPPASCLQRHGLSLLCHALLPHCPASEPHSCGLKARTG